MRVDDFSIHDKTPVSPLAGNRSRPVESPASGAQTDTTHISNLAKLLFPDENRIQQLRSDLSSNRYQVVPAVVSRDVIAFYAEARHA
jgi:hypothetical protein